MIKIDYTQPPVLRGDIYCSPWCGGRCKKSDYDWAVAEADRLAREMGPGWEPVVHENLGWFYYVKRGSVEVYDRRDYNNNRVITGAWCSLICKSVTTGVQPNSVQGHQFTGKGATGPEAYRAAVAAARGLVELVQGTLASLDV